MMLKKIDSLGLGENLDAGIGFTSTGVGIEYHRASY